MRTISYSLYSSAVNIVNDSTFDINFTGKDTFFTVADYFYKFFCFLQL